MILKIQIFSLVYSFFYGIIFFFLLEVNHKLLYDGKIIYRIIISFLFIIVMSLLYFFGILRINNGIIHFYFYFSFFAGYLLSYVIYKKINCKIKLCGL